MDDVVFSLWLVLTAPFTFVAGRGLGRFLSLEMGGIRVLDAALAEAVLPGPKRRTATQAIWAAVQKPRTARRKARDTVIALQVVALVAWAVAATVAAPLSSALSPSPTVAALLGLAWVATLLSLAVVQLRSGDRRWMPKVVAIGALAIGSVFLVVPVVKVLATLPGSGFDWRG
jgi:RsiW-degrading membrane proteinase PrsW (M82 family)